MIHYTLLAPSLRCIVTILMFLSALSLMALCLYRYISTEKMNPLTVPGILFLLYALLLSYITACAEKSRVYTEIHVPWLVFVTGAVLVMIYSCINIYIQYRSNRSTPTPSSIKQALDNLPMGICFSDNSGRITLINNTMIDLISTLIGSYPQSIYEINEALRTLECESGSLYHFPDGQIWDCQFTVFSDTKFPYTKTFFSKIPVPERTYRKMYGYTLITASNVTELYETNARLSLNNEKLKEVNKKIETMLDRLADRIREQETLNLKIQVHNEIGTSLIAISDIIEHDTLSVGHNNANDLDLPIRHLENAVSYFSTERRQLTNSLDELYTEADNMNISLTIDGDTIYDNNVQALAISAIRECMTNTIRHADGKNVYVTTVRKNDCYTIEISNDGNPPASSDIREGGGLSNLRMRIEQAGGTMITLGGEAFSLTITLPI